MQKIAKIIGNVLGFVVISSVLAIFLTIPVSIIYILILPFIELKYQELYFIVTIITIAYIIFFYKKHK